MGFRCLSSKRLQVPTIYTAIAWRYVHENMYKSYSKLPIPLLKYRYEIGIGPWFRAVARGGGVTPPEKLFSGEMILSLPPSPTILGKEIL
jgi:hypothetical protein